jgi:hypothetical protein
MRAPCHFLMFFFWCLGYAFCVHTAYSLSLVYDPNMNQICGARLNR